MQDIIITLIVIVVTAILVGAIFWFVHQHKVQQEQLFVNTSSLRGWAYERIEQRLTSGFRLRGTAAGAAWELLSLRESTGREAGPGSSNVTVSTTWSSVPANPPGGLAMIGLRPAISAENASAVAACMGSMVVQSALRLMLGSDAAHQLSSMQEVEAGSASFRQRYMVWAHTEADARRLVSSSVESALLAWPKKLSLVIKLGPEGIHIRLPEQLSQPSAVDPLIDLGRHLLEAWQGGG